jgi:fatty-acyl-CoA synthase
MLGMMMQRPLLIADILRYADESFPDGRIVSVRTEGDLHEQSYAETARRVARLAHALKALGVGDGDRVATLAWNGHRHLELYYAISGVGAVCHTVNPRLSPEQMDYVFHHAGDRLLFLDTSFVPLVQAVLPRLPQGMRFVVMTDRAQMPESALPDPLCYEDLLAAQPDSYPWPEFDENTAAGLCYTSGTTGRPKGALFSHRSTVLHALLTGMLHPGTFFEGSRVLPVVPLFHVNAWGLPYSAPLFGADLVLPGGRLDGDSLFALMDSQRVVSAWGVPTVWMNLLNTIRREGRLPQGFRELMVGGSAAPRSQIEAFEGMGVCVCHAWGMTEMSPVGSHGNLPARIAALPPEQRLDYKVTQGRRIFGCEFKIVDEDGNRLPHDGKAAGELFVRGNTVVAGYFNDDEASAAALDGEGWFGTGDIASIDAEGFLTIRDRAKDLVKSGGEWISSIELENAAMATPGIAACAVIAARHPKWGERPLLVAVAEAGAAPGLDDVHRQMQGSFPRWQLPDAMVLVDALPLTATGKVSKLSLRRQFADYLLPELR